MITTQPAAQPATTLERWAARDSSVSLISGDYRDHGRERAVVGYDYEPITAAAPWFVMSGPCAEPFNARTWSPTTVVHFMTDREASAWSDANGYH